MNSDTGDATLPDLGCVRDHLTLHPDARFQVWGSWEMSWTMPQAANEITIDTTILDEPALVRASNAHLCPELGYVLQLLGHTVHGGQEAIEDYANLRLSSNPMYTSLRCIVWGPVRALCISRWSTS